MNGISRRGVLALLAVPIVLLVRAFIRKCKKT